MPGPDSGSALRMSERIVSNPIELHKLSLVDKQKGDTSGSSGAAGTGSGANDGNSNAGNSNAGGASVTGTPVKQRARPVVPIASPTKVKEEPKSEDGLYKLASKQREIFELEQKLKQARVELKQLEEEVGKSLGYAGMPQESLRNRLQKRIEEVNRSPNVIRTKQSMSNLIQRGNTLFMDGSSSARGATDRDMRTDQRRSAHAHAAAPAQAQPSAHRQNGPPLPSRPREPQKNFFKSIVDKFHEMTQEEEDFDDQTTSNHKDKYYIGETYGYDQDEEDEDPEDHGEPLEHINDIPTTLFKR